jgi:hypothetical protein
MGLKAGGDPDGIADLAAARERFDEAKRARWKLVRAGDDGLAGVSRLGARAVRELGSVLDEYAPVRS